MQFTLKNTLIASAAVMATLVGASAHAATSAELKIIGKITPPSCDITLDGNGIVDFGSTAFNTLQATGTKLTEKTVPIAITCDGLTRVGLAVVDNRASTKVAKSSLNAAAWASTSTSINDNFVFGLGSTPGVDGEPVAIGGVMIGLKGGLVTVDGNANSNVIYSADKSSWSYDATLRQFLSPSYTYSFVKGTAGTSNNTPIALQAMTGDVSVVPTINRLSLLPTSDVIDFDGSVTISLVYL